RLPLLEVDTAGAAQMAYGLADEALARAESKTQGPRPECAPGCSFCCHVNVDATLPEIAAMASFLRRRVEPAARAKLREKLLRRVAASGASSDAQRWTARVPCALLDEGGRCSAYPVRPLRCRAFHSLRRDACRDAFEGTSDELPSTNPALTRAVEV